MITKEIENLDMSQSQKERLLNTINEIPVPVFGNKYGKYLIDNPIINFNWERDYNYYHLFNITKLVNIGYFCYIISINNYKYGSRDNNYAKNVYVYSDTELTWLDLYYSIGDDIFDWSYIYKSIKRCKDRFDNGTFHNFARQADFNKIYESDNIEVFDVSREYISSDNEIKFALILRSFKSNQISFGYSRRWDDLDDIIYTLKRDCK